MPVQAETACICTEHGQNQLLFTCKRVGGYAKRFQVAHVYSRLHGHVGNSLSKGQKKDYIILVCCSALVVCSGFLLTLEKTNPSMCITKIVLSAHWVNLSVQQSAIFISTFPTWPSASEENNLKEVAFSQTSSLTCIFHNLVKELLILHSADTQQSSQRP